MLTRFAEPVTRLKLQMPASVAFMLTHNQKKRTMKKVLSFFMICHRSWPYPAKPIANFPTGPISASS